MNAMKKLFLILVIFGLVASPTYGRLGDTETQILASNVNSKLVQTTEVSKTEKWLIFQGEKELLAVMLLDGKSEGEFRHRFDGQKIEISSILDDMHSYAEVWEGIPTGSDCSAGAVSANGGYFAKIGCAPALSDEFWFVVFTKKAKDIAAQFNKIKANTITI